MVLRLLACLLVTAAASTCVFSGFSQGKGSGKSHALVFLNSAVFDKQVSSLMASSSESITVRFAAPLTMNEFPPARLEGWLVHLGGPVETNVDPDYPVGRSPVLGLALTLAVNAYGAVAQKRLYKPAEGYQAKVLYAPADATNPQAKITRVVFSRRHDENS